MKNLRLFYILSIAFLVFLSSPSYSSHSNIWEDENELTPYFKAIQFIRTTLEACIEKEEWVENGFEGWSTPFQRCNRTPRYLFLETATDLVNEKEQLISLYTPFGEIKFFGSGSFSSILSCSKNFLENMKDHWKIKEVSDVAKAYNFSNFKKSRKGTLDGPYPFKKEPWSASKLKSHLYLVFSINDYTFLKEEMIDDNSIVIYPSLNLSNEQLEFDNGLFLKLSSGLNEF